MQLRKCFNILCGTKPTFLAPKMRVTLKDFEMEFLPDYKPSILCYLESSYFGSSSASEQIMSGQVTTVYHIDTLVSKWEQGWRTGENTRLPPMWPGFDSWTWRHMWVEFLTANENQLGSCACSERFFSRYSGFPLSSKASISKFQFNQKRIPIP